MLVSFHASIFDGVPEIMEPDKRNELKWVPVSDLPKELIDTRKMIIEDYLHSNTYPNVIWI